MNVLVTGSSGFFGSWLVPGLETAGHAITLWDIKEDKNADIFNLQGLYAELGAQHCDAIVHLAALPHYKEEIPPQEFTRVNILGTMGVLRVMRAANIGNLVYMSSGAIYGFGPGRPVEGWVEPPISETQRAPNWAMIDVYGASKLAAEAAFKLMSWRPRITSLRINCIEPWTVGAITRGDHWGWWVSQATVIKAVDAALLRKRGGLELVNVAEPNDNMDLTQLDKLLGGAM